MNRLTLVKILLLGSTYVRYALLHIIEETIELDLSIG